MTVGLAPIHVALIALLFVAAAAAQEPVPPAAGDAPAFAGLTCLGKNEQQQYEYRHEATEIVFVLIPAGEFWMGSPDDEPGRDAWGPNELRHRVRITKPYLMGKYEITNDQFRKHFEPSHKSGMISTKSLNGGSLPATYVNWFDATGFCTKVGFRLPTEAEWEWAARGGDEKNVFPWGKDWPPPEKAGNFMDAKGRALQCEQTMYYYSMQEKDPASVLPKAYDDGLTVTSPVGSFSANGYGLHDMAGNVSEWCGDWSGQYPDASAEVAVDPVGPSTNMRRVLRGGSWQTYSRRELRCADRGSEEAGRRAVSSGFRVVLAPATK